MGAKRHPDTSLILGRNPVRELLERDPGRIEKVLLQRGTGGADIAAIRRLAAEADVQVQYVPAGHLQQLAGGLNHQGVVARAAALSYTDFDDLLQKVGASREDIRTRRPRILVLDGIQDPFNFGAILRSAAAFGAAGVVVPQRNMAPLNAAAMKASAGTAGRVPIARVTNLAEAIYQLKERGYWVAGADADGDTDIWEMDWERPLVIVLGSEGKGLRPRTLSECDYRLRIPIEAVAESLNVSVAAGILLCLAAKGQSNGAGRTGP